MMVSELNLPQSQIVVLHHGEFHPEKDEESFASALTGAQNGSTLSIGSAAERSDVLILFRLFDFLRGLFILALRGLFKFPDTFAQSGR